MRNVRFAVAFAAAVFIACISQAGTVLDPGGFTPSEVDVSAPDPIFTFSFSDPGAGISGYGSIDTTGAGPYHATSGSITVVTDTTPGAFIGTASLASAGPSVTYSPSGAFIVDNLLYNPSAPNAHLDVYGLLFTASGWEINLWGNDPSQYSFYTYKVGQGMVTVRDRSTTVSVAAAVPLPATANMGLALLGCMGGLGAFRKLKRGGSELA